MFWGIILFLSAITVFLELWPPRGLLLFLFSNSRASQQTQRPQRHAAKENMAFTACARQTAPGGSKRGSDPTIGRGDIEN